MRQPRLQLLCIALLAAAVSGVGCDSHADAVCENIAACSLGGDSDWIARCQNEAQILKAEANAQDCRKAFDAYYACADDHYVCHGATASFPTCDAPRAALDECLARAGADSACGELAAHKSACSAAADGGEADAGSAQPTGCDLTRECQARCFLDNAPDLCAPSSDQLAAYTECANSCP